MARIIYRMDIDKKKKILDDLIQEAFNEFLIFDNSEFLIKDTKYLSDDMQIDWIAKISKMTYNKITPAIRKNLKLVYNIPNNDLLVTVIYNKVSLVVINYSVEYNSIKK